MTKADLDSIELQLNIRLPENYKSFMISFPTSLSVIGEVFDDNNFCNDPIRLIYFNQLLSSTSKRLLHEMFCIGKTEAETIALSIYLIQTIKRYISSIMKKCQTVLTTRTMTPGTGLFLIPAQIDILMWKKYWGTMEI